MRARKGTTMTDSNIIPLVDAAVVLRLSQRVIHDPDAIPVTRQEARDTAVAAHTRIQQLLQN
jgi:hypothetical protein